MKVGTLVNFIPPHNKPIPLIQGIVVGVVEKFASQLATEPTTHYEVQWLTGVQDPDHRFGVCLPCQLEVCV